MASGALFVAKQERLVAPAIRYGPHFSNDHHSNSATVAIISRNAIILGNCV